jgi:hypothetical protein
MKGSCRRLPARRDHRAERGQPLLPAIALLHPPAPIRAAFAGSASSPAIARACPSAPSATIRSRPGSASIPAKAAGEAITGRAIAIASSNLFWIPRAIRSGATTTFAAASQVRTSSTAPVTTTLSPASRRTVPAGLRPTIAKVAAGTSGSTSPANQETASILGA